MLLNAALLISGRAEQEKQQGKIIFAEDVQGDVSGKHPESRRDQHGKPIKRRRFETRLVRQ